MALGTLTQILGTWSNFINAITQGLNEAEVKLANLICIGYAKGPSQDALLRSVAITASTGTLLWDKLLVLVNRCLEHTEMG